LQYIVCVPYYSLPEFPSFCRVVSNRHVLLRDILLCNPSNFHVRAGVQYDPHLETLEYINCEPHVRNCIVSRSGVYKDIRIVFRTRFLRLDGTSDQLVTGYYIVGPDSNRICREAPVVRASTSKFLSETDCINITSLLQKTRAYRSCFTSENNKWRPYLKRWIKHIDNRRDATADYVAEIQRLKKIYGENEFRGATIPYAPCEDCSDTAHLCPLIRRRIRCAPLPRFLGHFE